MLPESEAPPPEIDRAFCTPISRPTKRSSESKEHGERIRVARAILTRNGVHIHRLL